MLRIQMLEFEKAKKQVKAEFSAAKVHPMAEPSAAHNQAQAQAQAQHQVQDQEPAGVALVSVHFHPQLSAAKRAAEAAAKSAHLCAAREISFRDNQENINPNAYPQLIINFIREINVMGALDKPLPPAPASQSLELSELDLGKTAEDRYFAKLAIKQRDPAGFFEPKPKAKPKHKMVSYTACTLEREIQSFHLTEEDLCIFKLDL